MMHRTIDYHSRPRRPLWARDTAILTGSEHQAPTGVLLITIQGNIHNRPCHISVEPDAMSGTISLYRNASEYKARVLVLR